MKKKYKVISLLVVMVSSLIFSGCGQQTQGYKVNLEVWGLYDDSAVYGELINQYKKLNPYVGEIKYRKFTADTYKQDLLEAFAAGQGPDIFLIHNTWLPSFENKLESAPKEITNLQEMQKNFPEVVSDDFVSQGKIYAYPLSVDSLVLYYNKDILNAAGIAQPPRNWKDFNDAVQKTTIINNVGNIIQAGAALGTGKNVNRSSDILSLLMLQNGAEMTNSNNSAATFDEGVIGTSGDTLKAGENALAYYSQFAKLTAPTYTWNQRQPNSMDAFYGGRLAMTFNYSYQIQNIKAANPKLNYGIAPLPQLSLEKPVSYANYWAFAVSKNKVVQPTSTNGQQQAEAPVPNALRVHEAWQFLRFLTVNHGGSLHLVNGITKKTADFPITIDPATEYLKKTYKPAARRDLIEQQKTDPVLGPFASGNLIAKSWYQADPDAVDQIFTDMIDSVNRGDIQISQALNLATNRVTNILQSRVKFQ